ncbi:MAG TPA: anaerobic C4-dicarboxylate transporter family protein [Vicinamibacterales bacterium]|nr:anaerobic C4-dicarboxylate transporter family protein [Vicinamibacterales bacterium]
MIWLELGVLVACVALGARLGGIALGTVAGVGLVVFVLILGLPPGGPPGVVIGMIIATITAVATMQAAGGLDYLVAAAARVMRHRPQYITVVAPIVTWLLVLASGTTHVIYALLPIIAEVSERADVRPERPLSISVVAGFHGVRASPISAATVAIFGFLAPMGVTLPQLLAITIPSTLIAVLAGALSVAWRGVPLSQDPEYQRRIATGLVARPEPTPAPDGRALINAKGSTLLFAAGVLLILLIGAVPSLRPVYDLPATAAIETDQVTMGAAIMIVMLAIAGLTMIFFQASPKAALKGSIMSSGVSAIICIVGVSWLGSSFFEGNRTLIVDGVSSLVRAHPWMFAVGLFMLTTLLFSAAAAVAILVPVGVALGMPASVLIASYPASSANFFLPTYGTLLAAVSFDRTGTTRIGKYLLDHSFMRPGLVATVTAVVVAFAIGSVILR